MEPLHQGLLRDIPDNGSSRRSSKSSYKDHDKYIKAAFSYSAFQSFYVGIFQTAPSYLWASQIEYMGGPHWQLQFSELAG
jgi:hypothetical protein